MAGGNFIDIQAETGPIPIIKTEEGVTTHANTMSTSQVKVEQTEAPLATTSAVKVKVEDRDTLAMGSQPGDAEGEGSASDSDSEEDTPYRPAPQPANKNQAIQKLYDVDSDDSDAEDMVPLPGW